jgi:NhaP-type Na+/H+ or K+/H+ antiporter
VDRLISINVSFCQSSSAACRLARRCLSEFREYLDSIVNSKVFLLIGSPADFEKWILLIDLTLGVVLMSLLQGTSINWLLRKLGLVNLPTMAEN